MMISLLLLLCLLMTAPVLADNAQDLENTEHSMNYYARQLSFSEGLSHHSINCIQEDSQNNLWIGTKSGLNKLTENKVEKYFSFSLSNSSQKNITAVECDLQDNVWAICNGVLERKAFQQKDFSPVSELTGVMGMALTKDGSLYVSAQGGIWQYDRTQDRFVKRLPVKANRIRQIMQLDEEHCLLMEAGSDIWVWNTRTNDKTLTDLKSNQRHFDPVVVDEEGYVWKTNSRNELVRYSWNSETNVFRQKNVLNRNREMLSHAIIGLYEHKGKILLATDGEGILEVDRRSMQMKPLNVGNHSHLVKSARSIYVDRFDNIWVGTPRQGCILLSESFVNVWSDTSIPGEYGLSSTIITGILQTSSRDIYISTDGGGLNHLDLSTRKISYLPQTKDEKITSIVQYDEDHILLYYYEKGLFLLDVRNGQIRPFTDVSFSNKSMNIKLRKQGHYIELLGNQFMVFDQHTRKVRNFHFSDEVYPGWVFFANDGNFAYNSERLYMVDPENAEITSIYTHDQEIFTACCSLDGKRIYFSDRNGLNEYDISADRCRLLRSFKGSITCIKNEDENRLWMGTINGLYRWDFKEDEIFQMDDSEGVPQDSYNPSATCVADNGCLYFGGVRALVEIDRSINVKDVSNISVLPVSLQIDNREPLLLDKIGEKTIKIPWNYTSVMVHVRKQGNIYLNSNSNMKLLIEGKYNSSDIVNSSSFQLPLLPPGCYKISLATEDRAGKFGTPQFVARLKVKAPFWKTGWGVASIILVVTLICVGIVIYFYNYKKHALKRRYERKEKVLLKMQNNFLINISHEFRTPLTLIFSPLKKILSSGDRNSELYGEVRRALRHAVNMNSLVDMVLDVNKIEKNNDGLLLHHASLNQWLQVLVDEFRPEFDNHEVNLVAVLDEKIGMVDFDVNRCRMVLSNFLMNALKFSPAGTEVKVISRLEDGMVKICVSDSGKGMDEANLKNCFRRYWQGEGSKGFGIGLSYAKIIVDMHHGHIGVYNNEGPGATFWFEIPLVQEDSPFNEKSDEIMDFFKGYEETSEPSLPEIQLDTKKYSILIVDDNEELRTSLVNDSKGRFSKVYSASNGKEALDLIFEKNPDLVISDVKMPVMDGFELCRTIKSTLEISHIPVILLSSYADAEQKLAGYKIGADAYLAKPFDSDLLLAMVQKELYTRECLKKKYAESLVPIAPSESTFSGPDENFITRLNEIITNNIDNSEMGINLILQEMQMGRNQFYAKLKSLTDMTLRAYINRIRINMACTLIEEGNSDFSDIAYRLGYSSPAYFSTVFKQEMGVSPKEYRAKNL